MKHIIICLIVVGLMAGCAAPLKNKHEVSWKRVPDVAQYKGADWANKVHREYGISLEKAMQIGASNPNITYFFYMKGERMYLEGEPGPKGWTEKGVFRKGDAVFFSGKPWYGSAPGFADSYEKQ